MRKCRCKKHVGDPWVADVEFTKNARQKDGIENICKVCKARKAKEWRSTHKAAREEMAHQRQMYFKVYYEQNKAEVLAKNKKRRNKLSERLRTDHEYRVKTYKKRWLSYIRTRARKSGIDFNITVDDLNIPDVCPVLGIPIVVCSRDSDDRGPTNDNAPTLDRLDNSKGYISGNVMVVSWRANRLKNNASLDELERMLTFYSKYFNNTFRGHQDI